MSLRSNWTRVCSSKQQGLRNEAHLSSNTLLSKVNASQRCRGFCTEGGCGGCAATARLPVCSAALLKEDAQLAHSHGAKVF